MALNEDAEEALKRDMKILRSRIIVVLERMIQKFKIANCLSVLLADNAEALENIFSEEERRSILKDFRKYVRAPRRYTTSSYYVRPVSGSQYHSSRMGVPRRDVIIDPRIDVKVTRATTILFKNEKVVKFAECYYEKKESAVKEFLNEIMALKDIFIEKLNFEFEEERQYEKMIGKMWKMNEYYKMKIAKREKELKDVQSDLENKLSVNNKFIEKYNKKLEDMKSNSLREKMKIINIAERTMAVNTIVSKEKTEMLSELAKEAAQQYENILEEHLRDEKLLRTKRFKVETQLANWISKYDTEVGDLHKILETEMDGYNEEKARMDDLEEKFSIQEEEYVVLMQEKAIEDQRLFDLKLVGFIRLRSVKVIQRWWRRVLDYRARRWGRRKRKKKGVKKK